MYSVGATTGVKVDAVVPTITDVAPPAGGTYPSGQNLDFTATFTKAVTVVTTGGTPYMSLTIGGVTKHAVYTSGSGTTALKFVYTLAPGDAGALATNTGITLNGGTIKDGAGNSATLTFTAPTTSGITVDAVAPTITDVAPPAGGTYPSGQDLDFTATFTKAVTVVTTGGTPYMSLTIGGVTKHAVYTSGSGTTALKFVYTLAPGDAGALATNTGITLNGGTIKDGAGNSATLTFTAPTTSGITVDAVAPTISGVAPPAAGTYALAQNLDFTATFTKPVTVVTTGGTPYIPLTVGGMAKHAVYTSGSGTTALVFRYTLASGDAGAVAAGTGITLDGGTIKDGAGNSATLSFAAPTTTGITVDAVAPTISGVAPPASGTYASGQNLDFTATFTKAVTVATAGGTPYLALTIGGATKHAEYTSGSGTTSLVFRFTLASGDYDVDGVALASDLALDGGTIEDAAGNAATLTFAGGTVAGVLVDARPSQTIAFGTLASLTYGTGFVKLTAAASSGLPVSYASANSAAVRISNDTAYLLAADTATITASQAGTASHLAAASVSRIMTVTRKPLSITGVVASGKVYDGTVSATVTGATLLGVVNSDAVALALGTATFASKDVGSSKVVMVTGSVLAGAKAGNYSLTEVSGLTGEITPKPISVTAEAKTKVYGSNDPVFTYAANPSLLSGDAFTGSLSRATGETAGSYAIAQGSLSAGSNYAIAYTGADLVILASTSILSRPVPKPVSHELGANVGKAFSVFASEASAGRMDASHCIEDNSCLSVEIVLPGSAKVAVSIFDNLGTPVLAFDRLVSRSDLRKLVPTGDGRWILPVSWNLRGSNGTPVRTGVYLWKIAVESDDGQKLLTVKKLGVRQR